MKGIIVLALVLLAGCSSMVPMEQLEAKALITGDWSAVERRERIIARRNLRDAIQCPSGMVALCDGRFAKQRCTCVSSDSIRSILNQF